MSETIQAANERVRRELWAAIYRQAHEQSAARVRPQFCFVEDADAAVAAFDKRFALPPITPGKQTQGDSR